MSEQSPTAHNPGIQDPSLTAGQPTQVIDPVLRALATDPTSLTQESRNAALQEAKRKTGGEKVIIRDGDGDAHWGKEITKTGEVFAFDGTIRGHYDLVDRNPAKRDAAQEITGMFGNLEGTSTHVIMETDDGQQILIRKTNDRVSANKQTFDIVSTSMKPAQPGEKITPRELDTSMLKGVVAMIGEPLTLGADPESGLPLRTRGAITKITSFNMTDKGRVDPRHPHLTRPEMQSDAVQQFGEAMKARQQSVAAKAGKTAVEHVVPGPEAPNTYEHLTDEELMESRAQIVQLFIDGIRKYDPAEVTIGSINLATIQRELESRGLVAPPIHPRGTEVGSTTYVTEPDPQLIEAIVQQLQSFDGGTAIASAMYGSLETPQNANHETKLQHMEKTVLLSAISKRVRQVTGSEFAITDNPYASRTNENLAKTVAQFKATITDMNAKGQDTTDLRNRLALVGQVIKSRQ